TRECYRTALIVGPPRLRRSCTNAPKSDERVIKTIGTAERVRLTSDFAPLVVIERRKYGIARKRALNLGDIQRVGERKRIAVERAAADAEYRRRTIGLRQRVCKRSRCLGAF